MGKKNFSPDASPGKTTAVPFGQKSPEQRRLDREARQKRNQDLAAKPNARVMEVGTPYSDVIFQIHRQMDLVWMHLKARSGEPGGVSYEQMATITEELQCHIGEFHKLTKKLAKLVGWNYKTPEKLKPILAKIEEISAASKAVSTETAPAAPEKIHALPAKPAAKPQASTKPGKEKKGAPVAAAAASK